MNKTARLGLTWDQEYKPYVEQIRESLKGFGVQGTPTSTELFLLFLAFGFKFGVKRDVPARKTDGPRFEYINDDQKAMIKSVSLAVSGQSDSLLEEDSLYDLAESLAAGGLMMLADAYNKNADFPTWLKRKLAEFTKST